jgi:hypothetical protein
LNIIHHPIFVLLNVLELDIFHLFKEHPDLPVVGLDPIYNLLSVSSREEEVLGFGLVKAGIHLYDIRQEVLLEEEFVCFVIDHNLKFVQLEFLSSLGLEGLVIEGLHH